MAENPFAQFQGRYVPDSAVDQPSPNATGPAPSTANPFANLDGNNFGIDFDAPVAEVRAAIGALPERQRRAATDAWAQHYVRKEREQGGLGYAIENRARAAARGTPIGSFLDEVQSLGQAGLYNVTGGFMGSPYAESQAYQAARDQAFDEANRGESLGLQIAGGVVSAPLAPVARAFSSGSLLGRMGNLGISGGLYGGLYGAGLGEGVQERTENAALGAGTGAALGLVTEPVARGVGHLGGAIVDRVMPRPQALRGYERRSIENVSRGMAQDRVNSLDDAVRGPTGSMMGDEAMLLDAGPNLRVQGERIVALPGEGATEISTAVNQRLRGTRTSPMAPPVGGAASRIRSDLDAVMGPNRNMPVLVRSLEDFYKRQAAPYYRAFHESPVPVTENVQNVFGRIQAAAPGAIGRAARLISADRPDFPIGNFFARLDSNGNVVEVLRYPSAIEWDYIKRGIDGMRREALRSGADDVERAYGNLSRDLRSAIDSALSPNNPSRSVWALARGIAGEEKGLQEAIELGQTAFRRNFTRDEMVAAMQDMSQLEREVFRVAARGQIENAMRASGTNLRGPSPERGASAMLASDDARDRLAELVGPDGAERLVGRLDTEAQFEATRQGILGNSATPRRLEASDMYPGPIRGAPSTATQTTGVGLMVGMLQRLGSVLAREAVDDRNARIALDSARMLAAQGADRDQIVRALLLYRTGRSVSEAGAQVIEEAIRRVMSGGRPAAVEEATVSGRAMLPGP